ncbi:Holliday junction resolvase RuvX [Candidatus Falkowbacteria bacterium CG_4_10_14_0_2_um_filter_41_15]|uniref:Putative pre-16S rRNA nuclease n=4 Tax=Candidatus Falkowiibacteriota TaxID=1752728 RepID=A0A2G9ZMB8_9BACT|nr:MAG: hypothetical protein AUJ35_01565 [Candidatus Falkowbacteria bacterium CG1_02_41_21]PIP34307.1 MAG: Holliday junction resolvase RuvX [Candidatus Falkowbacteria bacterium CG23_combo_of_CG06-09_8_20_14_all_41_10]PIZ11079.1 MAG: Holliday junction resolvase RuvX [Candidatus Falkowbacteria bacterium CG_4_10_14_0_8_um_filter_41_36]PJA10061.1 MAG: Holliday junction resolvase RuvX [Candidatus Falkowbacteria bacterium CG_4_10_14_0_2_um_filter_41_15]
MTDKSNKIIKLIGIDWGEKRLGVALADSEVGLATPFVVAKNLSEMLKIIKNEEIDIIVLGEPQKMRGKTSDINPKFKEFERLLTAKTTLPIELIDERLSSKNADALIGGKKTKAPRDAIAAMIILQTYLDQKYVRDL